jgi:hypothetical protein
VHSSARARSRAATLVALQAVFPELAGLLADVQAGGVPAVLAGPHGGAVSALMELPAGQHMLFLFAELAGNDALLAEVLQHHASTRQAAAQQQQQQSPAPPPAAPPPAAASPALGAAHSCASSGSSPFSMGCALQQLQASISSSQHEAALQLLGSLSLALALHQRGQDMQAALASTQEQLQRQQELAAMLQAKLRLVEQQAAAQAEAAQASKAAAAHAVEQLKATQEQLEHALLCQICFDRPRDTVLMPCMHFLYCSNCVAAAKAAAAKAAPGGGGGRSSSGAGGGAGSAGSAGRAAANNAAGEAGAAVLKCPMCRASCSGQLVVHLAPV